MKCQHHVKRSKLQAASPWNQPNVPMVSVHHVLQERCHPLLGNGSNPTRTKQPRKPLCTPTCLPIASKPPTLVSSDHHPPRSPRPPNVLVLEKLWRVIWSATLSVWRSLSKSTVSVRSENQCGVHCDLRATSQWQTVHDDLQTAIVSCRGTWNVTYRKILDSTNDQKEK